MGATDLVKEIQRHMELVKAALRDDDPYRAIEEIAKSMNDLCSFLKTQETV